MERVYKALQKQYRRTKVHYGKGLTEQGEARKVSDVFVRLIVLERKDLESAFQKRNFGTGDEAHRKMEHVFNALSHEASVRPMVELPAVFPQSSSAEDDSFRVLLLASAGCGKTTLMTKFCPLMWANGELWRDQFDLVICGELRSEEICRARGISDLLGGWSNLAMESIEERQRFADFVVDYPHRICLVLDGLDETSFDSCSDFVKGVLRGDKLPGIRLVLTSRPCDDVFNLCEAYPFSQRLELVGFLPKDVEDYVKRVLDEKSAEKLLRVIREDKNLASVMTTPYLAARVCELVKWSERIPRCASDIFELMILQIAGTRSMKSYKTWKELPQDIQKEILDLGEFAFRMLISKQLYFSESQVKQHSLSKEAISLGMLVTCEPRTAAGRERQYQFSNLMLQENLSALFVALAGRLYPSKIMRLVEALGAGSGHLNMFWQLLASYLDEECMDCLCSSLLYVQHRPLPEATLEALLFDRNPIPTKVQETLCSHLSLSSMELVAGQLLQGLVEGNVVTTVENEMQCSRSTNNSDFFKTALTMWLRLSSKGHAGILLESVRQVDSRAAESCHEVAGNKIPVPSVVEHRQSAYHDLVYHCFLEYSLHRSSRLDRLCSVRSISRWLQAKRLDVHSHMKAADCYALQQVVKYHSHDIPSVLLHGTRVQNWRACHYPLTTLLLKCPNLGIISCSNYGALNMSADTTEILSCASRNESVFKVDLGYINEISLPACSIAMSNWPSLKHVVFSIVGRGQVSEEAADAFLSVIQSLPEMRTVKIGMHYRCVSDSRMFESSAYPSHVTLNVVNGLFF